MDWIRWLLGGVCHQMPEHCLMYEGVALALCARCCGMFIGIAISLLAQWPRGRRSGLPPKCINLVLGACILIWAVDGANSMASELLAHPPLYSPSNPLRLTTGMLCGLALGAWLYPILHEALWPTSERKPAIDGFRDLAPTWLTGAGVAASMLLWTDAPYWLWSFASIGSCLATFVLVNASLAGLLWPLDADRPPFVPLAGRLAIGTVALLAEMGGMALLRVWLVG